MKRIFFSERQHVYFTINKKFEKQLITNLHIHVEMKTAWSNFKAYSLRWKITDDVISLALHTIAL